MCSRRWPVTSDPSTVPTPPLCLATPANPSARPGPRCSVSETENTSWLLAQGWTLGPWYLPFILSRENLFWILTAARRVQQQNVNDTVCLISAPEVVEVLKLRSPHHVGLGELTSRLPFARRSPRNAVWPPTCVSERFGRSLLFLYEPCAASARRRERVPRRALGVRERRGALAGLSRRSGCCGSFVGDLT